MNFHDLLGIIDSEWKVISDLNKDDMIKYLVESFDANEETAHRALVNCGLI